MPSENGEVEARPEVGTTIVVGVDGSDHSRLALKWASDEAVRRSASLRIMHAQTGDSKGSPGRHEPVLGDPAPEQAVVDDARGLVATRHPTLGARTEVVEWPPALALTIASRSAELLVVGARGKGGFEELLLGSVSDQCIQYAHCPVAVVHEDPDMLPLRSVEPRIVVGIDGSLGSTRAMRWALEEATFRSASVEAVYAWQYPPVGAFTLGPAHGYNVVAREIVDAATDYAARWAPEVPITVTESFGATVPALLDASRGAELLVAGSRGHGGFKNALLGSVTHQCARHARCAVVVTRPRLDEELGRGASEVHGIARESTGPRGSEASPVGAR